MAMMVATDDMDAAVAVAAAALARGEVVAIPTDTVYGVAVDPFQPGAADRLFAAKQRPREVTIPVLVSGRAQAEALAAGTFPPAAAALVAQHWPGALTVVVPRAPGLAVDLGDDVATVGVRCPDSDFVRALCRAAGPLAVTSANLHGQPTPPDAAGVASALGDSVTVVVDGGVCAGAPSTVVDCTGAELRVLRQGAVVI